MTLFGTYLDTESVANVIAVIVMLIAIAVIVAVLTGRGGDQ
jgi:hypothetical protein